MSLFSQQTLSTQCVTTSVALADIKQCLLTQLLAQVGGAPSPLEMTRPARRGSDDRALAPPSSPANIGAHMITCAALLACQKLTFMPARRPYLSREGSSAKFSLDGTRTTNMPQFICQAIIQMECTMHVWSKVLTTVSKCNAAHRPSSYKLLVTWRGLFSGRAPPWCCLSVPPRSCLQTTHAQILTCSSCL